MQSGLSPSDFLPSALHEDVIESLRVGEGSAGGSEPLCPPPCRAVWKPLLYCLLEAAGAPPRTSGSTVFCVGVTEESRREPRRGGEGNTFIIVPSSWVTTGRKHRIGAARDVPRALWLVAGRGLLTAPSPPAECSPQLCTGVGGTEVLPLPQVPGNVGEQRGVREEAGTLQRDTYTGVPTHTQLSAEADQHEGGVMATKHPAFSPSCHLHAGTWGQASLEHSGRDSSPPHPNSAPWPLPGAQRLRDRGESVHHGFSDTSVLRRVGVSVRAQAHLLRRARCWVRPTGRGAPRDQAPRSQKNWRPLLDPVRAKTLICLHPGFRSRQSVSLSACRGRVSALQATSPCHAL